MHITFTIYQPLHIMPALFSTDMLMHTLFAYQILKESSDTRIFVSIFTFAFCTIEICFREP